MPVIVELTAAGVVVEDADDLGRLHLETDLEAESLRTALQADRAGELVDGDTALLDIAVLRSLAEHQSDAPD